MIWSILDDSEDFICSKRNTFVLQNSEAKPVDHYHKVLSTKRFSHAWCEEDHDRITKIVSSIFAVVRSIQYRIFDTFRMVDRLLLCVDKNNYIILFSFIHNS